MACLILFTLLFFAQRFTDQPAVGGHYTEGLIGTPRFINPLYASNSDVDADLTRLVYSGLTKWDPKQGIVPDIAKRVEISEDGKIYQVTLRDDVLFHNGEPLRVRDVLFTFDAITNPQYRSPLAASFKQVRASQMDDTTITFELDTPSPTFLSTLTFGILPADVWGDVPPASAVLASKNLEPIGSGPYQFESFTKDKKGVIRSYLLKRFPEYLPQPALVEELEFKFYEEVKEATEALENKHIEGLSVVPFEYRLQAGENKAVTLVSAPQPRELLLLVNQQTEGVLKTKAVREAMNKAIDREALVRTTLLGFGQAKNLPLLVDSFATDTFGSLYNLEEARTLIAPHLPSVKETEESPNNEEDPETQIPPSLTLKLTTVDSPEFVTVATQIKEQLAQIQIDLTLEIISQESFFSSVVEPRAFDLLLTGFVYGATPDPYLFWHSSQATQGGLNITGWKNKKADTALTQLRTTQTPDEQSASIDTFIEAFIQDLPAMALYESSYVFALPTRLKGVEVPKLITPADRFAGITSWYLKTSKQLR